MKVWWKSRAVIGGAIAVASAVAGIFGVIIDLDTQNQLAEALIGIATGVGGVLAIYGRVKAEGPIK